MLTAVRFRIERPASGFRRRSFVFGLPVAALLIYGAAAWSGEDYRLPRVEAARRSALAATTKLRQEAPATAAHLDRLIADAEIATADEATAPVWQRSPGRVESAWLRALEVAHKGLAEKAGRANASRARWQALESGVGAEVLRAQVESLEAGVGRREIAAAERAEGDWKLAQRFARDGLFDRAIPAAERARSFATTVHASFLALHSRFADPKNLRQWRNDVEATIAQTRTAGSTAFVIDKLKRKLHVYRAGARVATYEAEIGVKGLNQKWHAGDQATPEGRYRVTEVRGPNRTKYYKALLIDYPNPTDRARYAFGKKSGKVPLRAGIGSLIEIHGDGGQGRDWTDGCVALANPDMDRIFPFARVGTAVTIVGTF